jgi:hypothetical protein
VSGPGVLIWNEHVHERERDHVAAIYPEGIHGALAAAPPDICRRRREVGDARRRRAGLAQERLAAADALVWWEHMAQEQNQRRARGAGSGTHAGRHGPGGGALRAHLEAFRLLMAPPACFAGGNATTVT